MAAAVDFAKMVEFLINNGADVNIKTTGEGQSPIHFAAKNDACLSLKMLLAYDADMGARDYQERTPLQVKCLYLHNSTDLQSIFFVYEEFEQFFKEKMLH